MTPRGLCVACALVLTACDKGEVAKTAAPLSPAEVTLFKALPRGENLYFGGNYMKLSEFVESSFGRALAEMTKGFKEFTECWTSSPDIKVAGSASFSEGGGQMRMVFTGMPLPKLKGCADRASYPAALDADGKFLAIQIPMPEAKTGLFDPNQPHPTVTHGYLLTESGVVYTRQSMAFAGTVTPAARAELEADLAALGRETAVDDKTLQTLASKVDHTRKMWFVASAQGTPIANKLGEVYGSIDMMPGLSVDATAQVLDGSLAMQIMDGVGMMKKNAAQLPPEMRAISDNLTVNRSGDRIRATLKLSEAQVSAMLKQFAAFLPQR
jgi:hypothetical protein